MGPKGGKRIRESKRPKLTGRGFGPTFVMLRHDVIRSPQFRQLSGNAIKLLIFLAEKFNGKNNGDLSMARSKLFEEGWNSERTAVKARDELLDAGFIVTTRHGNKRICNLYAITWLPIDECPGKYLEVAKTITAPDTWKTKSLRHFTQNIASLSDAKAA